MSVGGRPIAIASPLDPTGPDRHHVTCPFLKVSAVPSAADRDGFPVVRESISPAEAAVAAREGDRLNDQRATHYVDFRVWRTRKDAESGKTETHFR